MKDASDAANVLAVPAAAIQDIMTARDIEVIEIGDDLYPKIKPSLLFASMYTGRLTVMRKINLQSTVWRLYVAPDMPEDAIYDITSCV